MNKSILEKINELPTTPGVYIFKDKAGTVLYIGKAASLKDRVRSYFRNKKDPERPVEYAIDQIEKIETKDTDTVLEAFILEQELIRLFQPKYNVLAKDDKSFVYLLITKEDFPRFVIKRKTDLVDEDLRQYKKVYGPYTTRYQLEQALKIMRRIFPFHNTSKQTEKECFDFQIGLCPGPYAGEITKEEYQKNINGIEMILKGKRKSLIKSLEKEMKQASKEQDYEKAAKLRNKLFSLKHIHDIALISRKENAITSSGLFRIEGYDISSISGQYVVGSMVVFDNENGELAPNKKEYRKFKMKVVTENNDVGAMEEMLRRRFRNPWQQPSLILLDGGKGHLNMAKRVLEDFKLFIPLAAVAKGPKRKNLAIYSYGKIPTVSKSVIAQVRDEAHRFAITYHRKLRGNQLKDEQ